MFAGAIPFFFGDVFRRVWGNESTFDMQAGFACLNEGRPRDVGAPTGEKIRTTHTPLGLRAFNIGNTVLMA